MPYKDIEKRRAYAREYAREYTRKHPYKPTQRYRLGKYKRNAKGRGLAWELTDAQANAILGGNFICEYGFTPHKANGIDRVDNSVGYTAGNVVPCCSTHNMMKGKMSVNEFNEALGL